MSGLGLHRTPARALLAPAQLATLALLLALLPLLWGSITSAPALRVEVGEWGDHAYLSGVNGVEENGTEVFRWTTGDSVLTLPNLSPRYRALRLRGHAWRPAGESPPLAQISLPGHAPAAVGLSAQQRVYSLLLPPAETPDITARLTTPAYEPPGDSRSIGVALDWLELRQIDQSGPTLWQFGGQALLLALLAALWLLVAAPWLAPPLTAASGLALLAANWAQPLWAGSALGAWLLISLGLLLASWLLAPRCRRALEPWMTPRQTRVVWGLLVAAMLLRLFGAVHPLFDAHDLPFHTGWMGMVGRGELVFYSTPGEFKNQETFNPPAGYLLLLPLNLLMSPRLAVQVGVALVDGLGCLLLLPLARGLGLGGRAALLGLALYVALPINTTMLWWGFATNDLAQTVGLALLWLLLRLVRRPDRPALALCAAVAAAALLTHVGALVLEVALLGLFLLLSWRDLPRGRRAALLLVAGAALLFGAALYFSLAGERVLAGQGGPGRTLAETLARSWDQRWARLTLMGRGLTLGFLPPLLVLAPLGLARLLPALRPVPRALVLAWLLTALAFMAVYLALGMMVRYYYFLAPLVCLAAGCALASLTRRSSARILTLALILLIAWSGTSLWVSAVLLRDKPSLTPLTH
jgi:toxin CptA